MARPRRLHADLARKAKREGVSLNQYVLYLLFERNSQRAATVESLPYRRQAPFSHAFR